MDLPTEPVKVENRNPKNLVLYGSPKVGKTSVLAALPKNLIVDLEGGSSQVEALKKEVNSFKEIQALGQAVIDAGRPYEYITVDTVTELENWCETDATRMYKSTPQGANFTGRTVLELDYGAGYYWLRQSYSKWLKKFKKLAPTVIYVAHLKDKFLTKSGKDVTAKDLDLTGKIKNITCKDADAIGYVYRDEDDMSKLRITFIHKEELLCGSRCKHLRGQDFVLAESDDSGEIVKTHWDKIFID